MCGITGLWAPALEQNRIRSEVTEAVASLRHRGPDDHGVWMNDTGVALGHTRLSILDLSAAGHQPMTSPNGRFTIVFNGEIYNFGELRAKLAEAGHSFSGSGDTEVILHAFSEWGAAAVDRFIGMFTIALWDEQEQELQLVRDRLGVKPLYYGWDGRVLCFGSELKALRAYTHWRPEIDRQALGEFLQYGYIAADRSIYRGIHKLKPGHRLTLTVGGQPLVERYWSPLETPAQRLTGTDADLEAELESLLVDAFRHRMVSDVPVGVYLSGGVDSSLVTSLLARHHSQQIRTFTIGFSQDSHNEARWAKAVAEHCGSLHTEHILEVDEALGIARDWGRLFDEPFGDSSGIPTLLVSRLASREVKVVLSADGGDELFSGYNVYTLALKRLAQLERLPSWLAGSLASASAWLPREKRRSPIAGRNPLARLHRLAGMLEDPTPGHLMEQYMSQWQPDTIDRMIGGYENPRHSANHYGGDAATQMSLWDIDHYLPEDILTKVDRTTMAVSIEGREPLLDHRLVRFALSLPPHLRHGALGPKHVLKSILYRYVPRELVDRPKRGFGIPLERWMKADLKELVHDHLNDSRIRAAGIMDAKTVDAAVKGFYEGDELLGRPLWLLLAFEMWRECWV